jgi:hypothetical protein
MVKSKPLVLGIAALPHMSSPLALLRLGPTLRCLSTIKVLISDMASLLLYVDDIVLTASSSMLLHRIISALQQEFAMKDPRELSHFLGISVQR